MSYLRSFAVGSTAGWIAIVALTLVEGTTNIGTVGAIALPASAWAIALCVDRRRTRQEDMMTTG